MHGNSLGLFQVYTCFLFYRDKVYNPGAWHLSPIFLVFPQGTFEPFNVIAQQGLKSHGQLSSEKCENWQVGRGERLRLVPALWKMQREDGLARRCLVAATCQLCINQSTAAFSEMSGG